MTSQWSPGDVVLLQGELAVFPVGTDFLGPDLLGSAVLGPEDTVGLVLSSALLRPIPSDDRFMYVLVLAGPHLGWVNSRSIRRVLLHGQRGCASPPAGVVGC